MNRKKVRAFVHTLSVRIKAAVESPKVVLLGYRDGGSRRQKYYFWLGHAFRTEILGLRDDLSESRYFWTRWGVGWQWGGWGMGTGQKGESRVSQELTESTQ